MFLEGNKTYIVGILTIIAAVWLLIVKAVDYAQFTTLLAVALGIMGLRSGIKSDIAGRH